jgi:hypothetical protein
LPADKPLVVVARSGSKRWISAAERQIQENNLNAADYRLVVPPFYGKRERESHFSWHRSVDRTAP